MKFTQIPATTFSELQLNAGVICSTFTPSTGTIGDIIGATSGGLSFSDTPSYSDWGDDIDNCPKNTKELKHIDDRTVTLSGTFATMSVDLAKKLSGASDIDGVDDTLVTPRDVLKASDFSDIWWVGDYSDVNTGNGAGFIAIKIKNALNTSGFSIQTEDKGKGKFSFEFTAHYSITNDSEVPYEIYVKAGSS